MRAAILRRPMSRTPLKRASASRIAIPSKPGWVWAITMSSEIFSRGSRVGGALFFFGGVLRIGARNFAFAGFFLIGSLTVPWFFGTSRLPEVYQSLPPLTLWLVSERESIGMS